VKDIAQGGQSAALRGVRALNTEPAWRVTEGGIVISITRQAGWKTAMRLIVKFKAKVFHGLQFGDGASDGNLNHLHIFRIPPNFIEAANVQSTASVKSIQERFMFQNRKRNLIATSLLLMVLSVAALAQDLAPKADEIVNAYVKQNKFSGSVLIAKGGKVILSKGYGMANYELEVPNTPQTKFRLGSITKQFTALAIAQLQERGQLNIEDPITKYLPDFPKETGDKVTIYHLLTHTSGIPSFTGFADYPQIRINKFSGEKLVNLLKGKPLEFAPGENFKYNNSGYFLLGYIIEKVSGKTYEQFVQENIFTPLAMKNTGFDRNTALIKNRAAGYAVKGKALENAEYIDMTVPGGAGAMYSTVEDLYIWDRALYTEKLVKKATLDKVYTPFKNNYAYGWVVDEQFKRKRVNHGGGIEGFNTIIARFINDDTCIIALSNTIPATLGQMSQKLAALLFGESYELPLDEAAMIAARKEIKVDPKIFDGYVGEYQLSPNFSMVVTREGDRLMVQPTGQGKSEIFPESETKFFSKVVNAQLVFNKNDKGEVDKLILYQNGNEVPGKKIK
jgi:CubicO group peptidase (beta-lactamase class C family)